jgi:hypothetical protein
MRQLEGFSGECLVLESYVIEDTRRDSMEGSSRGEL